MRGVIATLVMGLVMGLVLALGAPAAAEVIGTVKTVQGEAQLLRGAEQRPLTPGVRLETQDVLRTGPDGRVGVLLQDDTRLSLGPDSELALSEFRFAPSQGSFALVARLLRGTASYLSGQIGKLAPDAVRLETPVATIGTRGTKFAIEVEQP